MASRTQTGSRRNVPPPPKPRNWGAIASGVALALFAGGMVTYAAVHSGEDDRTKIDPIKGEKVYTIGKSGHTTDRVKYKQSPPVGGPHDATPQDCQGTVYDKPVKNEHAVHSMEHGAVWVTYRESLPKKDVDALAAKVRGNPYMLMSPYPDLSAPIVLNAWGHQLKLDKPNDKRLSEFINTYGGGQGPQTPEKGASCEGTKDTA